MRAVEGLDLNAELQAVRDERLREQSTLVRKAINGIYIDLHRWQRELEQAENTAKKAKEKIEKAQGKLTKLQAGDWSVLEEEKPPQAKPDGQ